MTKSLRNIILDEFFSLSKEEIFLGMDAVHDNSLLLSLITLKSKSLIITMDSNMYDIGKLYIENEYDEVLTRLMY